MMIRSFLCCLAISVLLIAGCKDDSGDLADTGKSSVQTPAAETAQPAAPPLPIVTVVETTVKSIRPGFEYPVTIEAVELAEMTPQVGGVIKKQHFSPGAMVNKDDLLIELDDIDYRINIDEIKARIHQSEAMALEAKASYERAEKLKPEGFVSEADYDAAKARYLSAKGMTEQLEAKLKRAEQQLQYTKIYAPFSGKISAANFAVGDHVGPATQQPLFELVKLDPVYAVGNFDIKLYEKFVLKRMQLKGKGMEIPDLEFSLILASGEAYPYKGVFVSWDNTAAGSAGTIAGRTKFPNPAGLLLPGHNLKLTGQTIDVVEGIMIPQKAVSQDQQGYYVFIVEADGMVQRRNIEVGIRHGIDWSVPVGLELGDRVVVEGLQKVRPGLKVDAQRSESDG